MIHRLAPILAGIAVILLAGVLHGYWTLRWHSSPAIAAAVASLDQMPGDFGEWKASPLTIPQEQLIQAGANGWKLQAYETPDSEVPINTLLLVGRAGAMTIHQPQHCYPGAGYEQKGQPVRHKILARDGQSLGEFWTCRFIRQTATGTTTLRIFWAWNASGHWRAPANPRWELASEAVLYKLYVIREETHRYVHDTETPSYAFLQELLPQLAKTLDP